MATTGWVIGGRRRRANNAYATGLVSGAPYGQFGIDVTATGWGSDTTHDHPTGYYTSNTATGTPPATGELRLNNASFASVTHIYASKTGQPGVSLATPLLSTFSVGDVLLVNQITEHAAVSAAQYTITNISSVSGSPGYYDFTVTYVASSVIGSWTNSEIYMLADMSINGSYDMIYATLKRDFFTSANGTGNYAKFYDGDSGLISSYNHFVEMGYTGKPVFCANKFVVADVVTLIGYMATNYPTIEYHIVIWQEPEDNMNNTSWPSGSYESGTMTPANWMASYVELYSTWVAQGSPALMKISVCLMNYQEQDENPYGPRWDGTGSTAAFLPISGCPLTGVVGWDIYDAGDQDTSWSFPGHYQAFIQASATACSTKYACMETGFNHSTKSGQTDSDTLLLGRVNAFITACQNDPLFAWANYFFDNNVVEPGYGTSYGATLISTPTVMAAWAAAVAA